VSAKTRHRAPAEFDTQQAATMSGNKPSRYVASNLSHSGFFAKLQKNCQEFFGRCDVLTIGVCYLSVTSSHGRAPDDPFLLYTISYKQPSRICSHKSVWMNKMREGSRIRILLQCVKHRSLPDEKNLPPLRFGWNQMSCCQQEIPDFQVERVLNFAELLNSVTRSADMDFLTC